MSILGKIKKFIIDIIGDADAVSVLISDCEVPDKEFDEGIKGYDNTLDAIADGKFGYRPEFDKLLRRYGRTFKGPKPSEKKYQESNVFTRTKKNAWLYDSINEALRQQAESAAQFSCDEEPKSFKEKIQKAEFVEVEIVDTER